MTRQTHPPPTNDTGRPIPARWYAATWDGCCCNGCGEPVHYPSRVLCRACFLELCAKLERVCGGEVSR